MYAVTVTFTIRAGEMDRFLSAMMENARASLATEPGCRQFDVLTDPTLADQAFLYELYDDRAAFEAHMQTAHFATVNDALEGVVVDKVIQTFSQVRR